MVAINLRRFPLLGSAVRRKYFIIQDRITGHDIDFNEDWDTLFSPGQQVVMTLYYWKNIKTGSMTCPHCQTVCDIQDGINHEW